MERVVTMKLFGVLGNGQYRTIMDRADETEYQAESEQWRSNFCSAVKIFVGCALSFCEASANSMGGDLLA